MERSLYQSNMTMIEIAENVFIAKGIDLVYIHHQNFWNLLIHVDRYIRNLRRKEFITSIASSSLRLEVYGNGWEVVAANSPHVKIGASIDFLNVQEKMKNSKIVATTLPNFIEGAHERVFTAMLNGAVSMVDTNLYIEFNFENNKNLITYNFKDNSTENAVNLISDVDKMQSIADNGRQLVSQDHTWLNRAEKIIETVAYHKFFLT